jgi:16S rRNA C967 or C1407 C5-methylase (RsmB/RsmF family)
MLAMHSLRMLKPGGLMTYSTCSMNPLENEAVVAEVLRRCGDSVEVRGGLGQVLGSLKLNRGFNRVVKMQREPHSPLRTRRRWWTPPARSPPCSGGRALPRGR